MLLVAGVTSGEPEIELPHPRLFSRAFVLVPLEEVAPELVPPRWRNSLGGDALVAAAVRRVGAILPRRSGGAA